MWKLWLPAAIVMVTAACGANQTERPASEAAPGQSPDGSGRSSADGATRVEVGPFTLTLDGCALHYEGAGQSGTVAFEFGTPCEFNRDSAGAVRIVQTGPTRTLLVQGSRPAEASDRLTERDCITFVRGVVISETEIRLSAQTQKVAQCLPAAWDETMFHAFAARTEPAAKAR